MRADLPLLCSLLLAACGETQPPPLLGYVEADAIRVAAPQAGRLLRLAVARGDTVVAGQTLFVLEQEREAAAVAEAEARVNQARATAADLDSGKRPQELAVLEAERRAAQAAVQQADKELRRHEALAGAGFVPATRLESLQLQRDTARARLAELRAQQDVARLAARPHSRQAATAAADAATAQLAQQRWTLQQKVMLAPVAARVEDSYYQPGEWVPAGSPVLSLLPPAALKIRFFVPATRRASARPGTRVTVSCDGCGAPMTATIRFVAREAEYTPPLIYSRDNRARLVWRVEAQVSPAAAARLLPGQPVDVSWP